MFLERLNVNGISRKATLWSIIRSYAWAKNINITGIARYLADGWVYRYYQSKLRYKNLFLQTYLNTSYSGSSDHPTRNLATGSLIYDRSQKFNIKKLKSFLNTSKFTDLNNMLHLLQPLVQPMT